jgi:hypothetical protein
MPCVPAGSSIRCAQVYAEKLSLDELRQIRAFHESPAAKHMQEAMPEMMQRVIQQSMATTRDIMPGLCARVKLRLQEAKLPESETFRMPGGVVMSVIDQRVVNIDELQLEHGSKGGKVRVEAPRASARSWARRTWATRTT